ncbi:MAG: hypothetical protein WC548_01385 [Candidatus Pacearchaeota archaeon]
MKKNIWKSKFKEKDILPERVKIMNPFIKKYGHPILVHAVEDIRTFEKIIYEGKIRLPKDHRKRKKNPLMEKFLGVDNSIFLSVGFDYWAHYNFKFNFIFDIGILKKSDYYARPLPLKCYTDIAIWLYENDKETLNKLKNKNKTCKEVVDKFIWSLNSDSYKTFIEFWKIEEDIYEIIINHSKKKKLFEIARERMLKLKRGYPYTKILAGKDWKTYHHPEIIHFKEIDLLKSPYFLGFFIEDKIYRKLEKVLREKYSGKIIFDGKKIKVLTKITRDA